MIIILIITLFPSYCQCLLGLIIQSTVFLYLLCIWLPFYISLFNMCANDDDDDDDDCMRNANKCPNISLFRNDEENEKVIRNPHGNPDHHN